MSFNATGWSSDTHGGKGNGKGGSGYRDRGQVSGDTLCECELHNCPKSKDMQATCDVYCTPSAARIIFISSDGHGRYRFHVDKRRAKANKLKLWYSNSAAAAPEAAAAVAPEAAPTAPAPAPASTNSHATQQSLKELQDELEHFESGAHDGPAATPTTNNHSFTLEAMLEELSAAPTAPPSCGAHSARCDAHSSEAVSLRLTRALRRSGRERCSTRSACGARSLAQAAVSVAQATHISALSAQALSAQALSALSIAPQAATALSAQALSALSVAQAATALSAQALSALSVAPQAATALSAQALSALSVAQAVHRSGGSLGALGAGALGAGALSAGALGALHRSGGYLGALGAGALGAECPQQGGAEQGGAEQGGELEAQISAQGKRFQAVSSEGLNLLLLLTATNCY